MNRPSRALPSSLPADTSGRLRDGTASYGLVSRVNHWLVAIAMLGMLASGLLVEYAPIARESGRAIMGWHQAIGVAVLLYGAWRVLWRLLEGFPDAVPGMPRWQERASIAVHGAPLAAILLMPLSGVLMQVYEGRAVETFGFTIAAQGEIEWLAGAAGWLHGTLGTVLVALAALHVGAVLKHHLVDRDTTLLRMIGARARRPDA